MYVFLADSLDGDCQRMRTCPKCGRANQPTRKYCIRCGANLLSVETKPHTISTPTEAPVTPEAVQTPPITSPPSESRVTTDDEWVKPSQVSRDRVRTSGGITKPKSEMEKAKEAFAKADQVGIEEVGEGIIEMRMLRASEVQELMGEMQSQREDSVAKPTTPPAAEPPVRTPTAPISTPPPSTPPPSTPPPSTPTATTMSPGTTPAQPQPTPPAAKPEMSTSEIRPTAAPSQSQRPDMPSRPVAPPAKPMTKPTSSAIPEIEAIIAALPDPAYRQDPQIIGIVNDLKNLHTEMAQFKSDLESVQVRLESEVQDYWNVAEVKRIQFESLEEQLRLSKQEWNDATKVYQQADKRMKNEVSSREKRIKDIQKRIEKAESGIEKRVKDLDKEKEKQESS